jgi:hypothetical protein
MAQPAFAAVGFSVVEHQIVQIGDQDFTRAMMEKPLQASADTVRMDRPENYVQAGSQSEIGLGL